MLFDLPDFDTLHAALLARDARLDGQVFVWRKQRLIEIERELRQGRDKGSENARWARGAG